MAEKIILEVDVAGLANDIQTARVALDSYRIALERSVEENGKFSKEATIAKAQFDAQNKAVKQLEGQLLRVTQAQQANNAILKDLVKQGYDPATKSVDQNRKVLNALTAEYNRASKEGREKLAPTIKQISDELKKQEGAIGDTRRNVGNYKEAITSAFGELTGFAGQIVQVGQNLGGSVNAFRAAEGGVKGFAAALATTGLPLIVLGINTLTEAFKQYEPIAEAVERATAGLSAAFAALIKGNDIVQAATEIARLTGEMQDLNDQQSLFELQAARNRGEVERLLIQSKRQSTDINDRLKLVREAGRIEREETTKNIEFLTKQVETEEQIFLRRSGLLDRYTEDAARNILDQLINTNDFRNEYIKEQNKITSDEIDVLRKRRAEIVAAQNESLKLQDKIANREAAIYEEFNKRREKQIDEEIKNEQKRIKAKEDAQRRIDEINRGVIDLGNDLVSEQERLDAIDERIAQRQADRYVKDFKDRQSALQTLSENNTMQLDLQEKFNQSQQEIDEEFAASNFKTFKDFYEAKMKLWRDSTNVVKKESEVEVGQILGFVTSAISQIGSLISESTDQRLQELETQVEAGVITQEEFNKRSKELKQQAFEETKAINIVNAVISTAQAVLNAYNSGLQAGGPAGPAVGAVFAGIAAAIGAAQIGIISAQQPPKFAEGGSVFDVGGKPHSEGGTLYTGADGNRFEVERGEKIFVLNRKASRHIDALGGLNMAFGGRSWSDSPIRYAADGGMIQDGGFGIRQTSEQANTTAMLKQFAKSIVSEMPTPVVSVVEFERVQTDRNKSISVADL